ncbi:MAG: hypothetical protein HRT40_08135 [Campylobacteraceae bacterium]|nr:hypothetical protein [Campylobacteraceae bacterium]
MALQKWEIFQDEATDFLDNYFNANFTMEGGFDSTTSHITVRNINQVITTIEAKFGSTQAGQIVLSSDDGKFTFCDKSKNDSNRYTQEIIKYLNSNYSLFSGVKTASIHVDISDSTLFNWVKTIYGDKNVEWIISSKKFNKLNENDLLFIPINEIEDYFDISLVFRRKKTGNAHIPGKDIVDFKAQMDLISEDYQVKKTDNKYLLTLNSRLSNFNIGSRYLLSMTNVDCQYYIKKKDINTNPNIMFQLNLKDNIEFKGERFKENYNL